MCVGGRDDDIIGKTEGGGHVGERGGGVAGGVYAVAAARGFKPTEEGVDHKEKKDGGKGAALEGASGDGNGGCSACGDGEGCRG